MEREGREPTIRDSVQSACELAVEHALRRIAMPIIGAGSGGFGENGAREIILDELSRLALDLKVTLVCLPDSPP